MSKLFYLFLFAFICGELQAQDLTVEQEKKAQTVVQNFCNEMTKLLNSPDDYIVRDLFKHVHHGRITVPRDMFFLAKQGEDGHTRIDLTPTSLNLYVNEISLNCRNGDLDVSFEIEPSVNSEVRDGKFMAWIYVEKKISVPKKKLFVKYGQRIYVNVSTFEVFGID